MLLNYVNPTHVIDYLTGNAAQDLSPAFKASNKDLKGKTSDFHNLTMLAKVPTFSYRLDNSNAFSDFVWDKMDDAS